jgi:ppGpp synthetase/RelA/SpoT-type nucleotidyltranferase
MLSNINHEQTVISALPNRGLSLGLRLTLSTALIVSIVMGGVSFIQHTIELRNQHDIHESLLEESLSPLAARIEIATTIEELRNDIEQFHFSYRNRGYPSHEVVLLDESKSVVFSTLPDSTLVGNKNTFKASVPISLQVPAMGKGTLIVFKDIAEYERSVKRQWGFWIVHMAITLGAIFLFLYPAIHFLVTKPIKSLVIGVRKMEMGYWGKVPIRSGAWEIRWLAWRFESMISEVRKAVAHFIDAERKAQSLIQLPYSKNKQTPSTKLIKQEASYSEDQTSPVYQDLLKKCQQLESASPGDLGSLDLAQKVWEEDSEIANRLGYWEIKPRLEDAALRLLNPEAYSALNSQLSEMKESLHEWAEKLGSELCNALEDKMIPCAGVFHRVKHTAGVWTKMQSKWLNIEEIHDLYAFRILVPTESDCYSALGVLHQEFKPVIGRFKDYIAHPKKNGYQSLHTCVKPEKGPVFEIQIRSIAMHQHSESGTAAHWIYKKNGENGRQKYTSRSWWSRLLNSSLLSIHC